MSGGETKLRNRLGDLCNKIDNDPSLSDDIKERFWSRVDSCECKCVEEANLRRCNCCVPYEMEGPIVCLKNEECLGTAQKVLFVAFSFEQQMKFMTMNEARDILLSIVSMEAKDGMKKFLDNFNGIPITIGKKIFAFRNESLPYSPWGEEKLADMFTRLAIPVNSSQDYIAFEFKPTADSARSPTSLDANLPNLGVFMHGGQTDPGSAMKGLPEVVTPPPAGLQLTKCPRSVI